MKDKPDYIPQEDWESVDSPPIPDNMLSRMRPVREAHPDIPPHVRGPHKVPISIRLSSEVVEYFKSQGKSWHTKINNVLTDYVETRQAIGL